MSHPRFEAIHTHADREAHALPACAEHETSTLAVSTSAVSDYADERHTQSERVTRHARVAWAHTASDFSVHAATLSTSANAEKSE